MDLKLKNNKLLFLLITVATLLIVGTGMYIETTGSILPTTPECGETYTPENPETGEPFTSITQYKNVLIEETSFDEEQADWFIDHRNVQLNETTGNVYFHEVCDHN